MADAHQEELFLLVVQDSYLQQELKRTLSSDEQSGEPSGLQLFMETARVGVLRWQVGAHETANAVTLHEIPTIVEVFKSHNHVNLVKSGDIGQVLLVHPLVADYEGQEQHEALHNSLQELKRMEEAGELPQEMTDGVTPPMKACARVFRKQLNPDPQLVEVVESQLISLMHGEAPEGWVIEDVVETFVEGEDGHKGKWVPLGEA